MSQTYPSTVEGASKLSGNSTNHLPKSHLLILSPWGMEIPHMNSEVTHWDIVIYKKHVFDQSRGQNIFLIYI